MNILASQKKLESLLPTFSSGLSQELFDLNQSVFEEEVKTILDSIGNFDSFEESKGHFDLLDSWQLLLAKIIYKQNLKASNFLKKFTSDFDRLDDEGWRKNLFSLIKNGEYRK